MASAPLPPPYDLTVQPEQYGYVNRQSAPPPGFAPGAIPPNYAVGKAEFPTYSTQQQAPQSQAAATVGTVAFSAAGTQPEPNVAITIYSGISVPDGVTHADTFMQFSDRSIKMAFIRKVYCILTVQLLITFGIICLFIFTDTIRNFCRSSSVMLIVSLALLIFCMVLMCCIVSAGRKYPINLILLGIFTICESLAVATFTTFFEVNEVLIAFGLTMVITISITVFTLQSKWDFTFCAVFTFILIVFAISFGSICGMYYGFGWNCHEYYYYYSYYYVKYFHCHSSWYIICCGFGALLFALYLMIDTAWMIGGKHKFGLSPEEYVFAALNLYLDIIMIFMYILMLLGGSRN